MTGLIADFCGHDADSRNKYQTFSKIAVIKKNLAEDGRNSALVSTILDTLYDTVQEPSRMQMRFQMTGINPYAPTQ